MKIIALNFLIIHRENFNDAGLACFSQFIQTVAMALRSLVTNIEILLSTFVTNIGVSRKVRS